MAWIESNQELGRHPKTRKLARLLGMNLPEAVGTLHFLWWWALDFARDGDLSRYTVEDVADAVLYEGEADKLIGALTEAGFVDRTDDGRMLIHDWYDYAGKLLERRAKDRERKQSARESSRDSGKVPAGSGGASDDSAEISPDAAESPIESAGIPADSAGTGADGARSPYVPYSRVPDTTLPYRGGEETSAREEKAHSPPPPPARESLEEEYGKALTDAYLAKVESYGHTGGKGLRKAAEWLAADVASGKIRLKHRKSTSMDLNAYESFTRKFTPVYRRGGEHDA